MNFDNPVGWWELVNHTGVTNNTDALKDVFESADDIL